MTKEQIRLKLLKEMICWQNQIIYIVSLNAKEKQQLLKLINKIENVIYDDIIADDIERGDAWNKKDQ